MCTQYTTEVMIQFWIIFNSLVVKGLMIIIIDYDYRLPEDVVLADSLNKFKNKLEFLNDNAIKLSVLILYVT